MPQVIELLSSSPPRATPPGPRLSPPRFPATGQYEESRAYFDEFDETSLFDLTTDRPTKRRRPSPEITSTRQPGNGRAIDDQLETFELAYEILSDDASIPEAEATLLKRSSDKSPRQLPGFGAVDHIEFSSSAPELRQGREKETHIIDESSRRKLLDDPWDELAGSHPQQASEEAVDERYSYRTTRLLASLSQEASKETKGKTRQPKSSSSNNPKKQKARAKSYDAIEFSSSPTKAGTAKSSRASESVKTLKATERAAGKANRETEKEAEKSRKRLERERKAQEKQRLADLAEVNKSKTNKKQASPEMIVDMSSFLKDTSVGNQLEEYLRTAEVETHYLDEEVNLTDNATEQFAYGNLVTWRRKVTSTYNGEDGQWEPTSSRRIVKEKHVLIHLPAAEFAALVAMPKSVSDQARSLSENEMKANIDAHVTSIRQRFSDCIPVYLIEGLSAWLKKNANAKNRAYTTAVRARLMDLEAGSSATGAPVDSRTKPRKRKKPSTESIDLSFLTSDMVEDLLLHLQLAHQPILIHHTTSPTMTASQIFTFTQHLSTRPYRLAQLDYNLKSASFCMDGGQVRTGDDARDTFVKMLQEVQRVTPSMAYGIVDKYDSVRKLVKGFNRHGNLLLEDIRKSTNKDGGWSDKRLGPMVSKRLFKVFMGRDPSSTDGMS